MSLVVLIHWEINYKLHPERFSERTNESLRCKNCTEKLCRHKVQLRHYIANHRDILFEKLEPIGEGIKETYAAAKEKTVETYEKVKDKTAEVISAATDKTVETYERVKDKTKDTYERAKEKTAEVISSATDKTVDAYEKVKTKTVETYGKVKEKTKDFTKDAYEKVKDRAGEVVTAVKDMKNELLGKEKDDFAEAEASTNPTEATTSSASEPLDSIPEREVLMDEAEAPELIIEKITE
jgi:gas vesicle protein